MCVLALVVEKVARLMDGKETEGGGGWRVGNIWEGEKNGRGAESEVDGGAEGMGWNAGGRLSQGCPWVVPLFRPGETLCCSFVTKNK